MQISISVSNSEAGSHRSTRLSRSSPWQTVQCNEGGGSIIGRMLFPFAPKVWTRRKGHSNGSRSVRLDCSEAERLDLTSRSKQLCAPHGLVSSRMMGVPDSRIGPALITEKRQGPQTDLITPNPTEAPPQVDSEIQPGAFEKTDSGAWNLYTITKPEDAAYVSRVRSTW